MEKSETVLSQASVTCARTAEECAGSDQKEEERTTIGLGNGRIEARIGVHNVPVFIEKYRRIDDILILNLARFDPFSRVWSHLLQTIDSGSFFRSDINADRISGLKSQSLEFPDYLIMPLNIPIHGP